MWTTIKYFLSSFFVQINTALESYPLIEDKIGNCLEGKSEIIRGVGHIIILVDVCRSVRVLRTSNDFILLLFLCAT